MTWQFVGIVWLLLVVLGCFWLFFGCVLFFSFFIFFVFLGLLRFSVHGPVLDSSLKTWFWAKCALWQVRSVQSSH